MTTCDQVSETVVRSVDLTGEVCPMTFVKAKSHLERVGSGQTVAFLLKDGEQLRSVAMSLKAEGYRVESVQPDNGGFRVVVRKC